MVFYLLLSHNRFSKKPRPDLEAPGLMGARIGHADKEIERRIRIADDKEQRRFPVPDQVKLQLVIHGDLPDLLNIEWRQSGAAANKYAFRCLASDVL